jgi:UDP-glucose 4-epimerase
MKVLVTGGAGYIGSVVTQRLVEGGHDVTVLDNLSFGWREAIHPQAAFVKGDLLDRPFVEKTLAGGKYDAVVHLAAEVRVGVSVEEPGLCYRQNVVAGINLLDAMIAADCRRIVFSSTAAVYGEPEEIPITEHASLEPVNPYGQTKLDFERALRWYRHAHGLKHIALRYFNACGATEKYGEYRRKESHIIPLLLEVALGKREGFKIFGTDYDTPDGTCVRDYVHVSDIARAHVLGLEQIDRLEADVFNMGNGTGFTNRQVIDTVREVTGRDIPAADAPRRAGDPARLVASGEKARQILGWSPEYPDLRSMVQTAWDWRQAHPDGYNQ